MTTSFDHDSLSRLALATGMTDVEFDERSQVEAEIASQQQIRADVDIAPCWQRMVDRAHAQRADAVATDEEFELMEHHARQRDEHDFYAQLDTFDR